MYRLCCLYESLPGKGNLCAEEKIGNQSGTLHRVLRVHACPDHAIDINWEMELPQFIERLVEYTYGAIVGKENKIGFMNFLIRITPDCDCSPYSDAPIVPDIGILASKDPVAIDAASFDLVNQQQRYTDSLLTAHHHKGGDKFKGVHAQTDGYRQVQYAEEIGLGGHVG